MRLADDYGRATIQQLLCILLPIGPGSHAYPRVVGVPYGSAARGPRSSRSYRFPSKHRRYSPWGALVGVKYGVTGTFAGIVTSNTYNKRLEPAILSAAAPSQTVLSLSYDFGLNTSNNGDVYGVTNNRDNNRSQAFTYDQLNRLASAQTTSTLWGNTYTYDIWGNLLQKTQVVGKTGGENLVQAVQTNNQLLGCGFDAAGNQTNDCLGNTLTYDAENRVITAGGVTYTYDGDGQRVRKSNGKLYWGLFAESDLSGSITAEFIFFGGKRIARLDLPSATVHYFFSDHLGSSTVVTNADGTTIQEESDYYPFGKERVITHTLAEQNFKLMGKERDLESGLDFFGARYYNSSSGRWLSPDWSNSPAAVPYATLANPQTLNLYAFVANNPATTKELDGHTFDWDGGLWDPILHESEMMAGHCGSICKTGIAQDGELEFMGDPGGGGYNSDGATQLAATKAPSKEDIAKGNFIIVAQRPLLSNVPTADQHYHLYIMIPNVKDGKWTEKYGFTTYGVLGDPPDKKTNQQVRKNDTRNGNPKGSARYHTYAISVSPAQRAELARGSNYWTPQSGHQCPECGKNYVLGGPFGFGAFNSNTWVYNMLIHNPAGPITPPTIAIPVNDGWKINDLGHNYYPQ
jgi:RHS repeat-associated protein